MKFKEAVAGVGILGALVLASSSCSEDMPGSAAAASPVFAGQAGAPEVEEVPLYPTREPDDTLTEEEQVELAFMIVLQGYGIDEFYIADMLDERIPQDICTAFGRGASVYEIGMTVYANSPLDFEQSGAVVGASVGGWCPEYDADL